MTEVNIRVYLLDKDLTIYEGQIDKTVRLCSQRHVPLRIATETGKEVVLCRSPEDYLNLEQIGKDLSGSPSLRLGSETCQDCRFHLTSPHISKDRPAQPNSKNLAVWLWGDPPPDRPRR